MLIPNTCTVVFFDELGAPNAIDFSFLLDKVPPDVLTTLDFNYLTKTFTYIDEQGNPTQIDISSCFTPPSTFDYTPATHTVTHNGIPHQLNCGRLSFDQATCALSYADEKGVITSFTIPRDRFVHDAAACTLTITPAKAGDATLVIPLGATENKVGLGLLDPKTIELTYMNKKCSVTLPNSIIGTQYDCATNTIKMIYCDGNEVSHAMAKPQLNVNTAADGTQFIQFDDGCGGTTAFSIPAVQMDTDSLTVTGSVLAFTYSGDDEQPGTVLVDICQIVADNCNATFTQINDDGSFTFIDNAGVVHNYPAPRNCCTFHTSGAAALDENAPPAQPENGPATTAKRDGDTLVEHHSNGLAFFTCAGGAWVFDYMHTPDGNCCHANTTAAAVLDLASLPAAPENPPAGANPGDTVLENHSNGLCAWTMTPAGAWQRDWCRVDPETPDDCCHYQGTDNSTLDPAVAGPTAPPIAVAAADLSDGDTAHVRYQNANCYWTRVNGNWQLDWCQYDADDCCHYHQQAAAQLDEANPPAAPLDDPAGPAKSDGDTLHVCHPNGSCYYTCTDGAWGLDFCKVDPPVPNDCCHYQTATTSAITAANFPASPAAVPTGVTATDLDTLHVCHTNGSCYYTHRNGAWALDYCKIDQVNAMPTVTSPLQTIQVTPVGQTDGSVRYEIEFLEDCCNYHAASATALNTASLPTSPAAVPTGTSFTVGDTLHVCHTNGSCYYTRISATDWRFDFCKLDSPTCCHYHSKTGDADANKIDEDSPPATPAAIPTGVAYVENDTLHVCHPNGSCYYTYLANNSWRLDFCKTGEDPKCCVVQRMCHPDTANEDVFQTMELTTRTVVIRDSNGVKINAVPDGYEPCDDHD